MSWDWSWFAPLGHAAVVWPLMIAMAVLLVARPGGSANLRGATIWLTSMAAASLFVAASKVAFYGWGIGAREWNLTCFSGHSVLAMGFWPAALTLIVPSRLHYTDHAARMAGALIGVLVGISRVKLNVHPESEVLAGLALGALAATVSLKALSAARLNPKQAMIAVTLVGLIGLWAGARLPNLTTERWLAQFGAALAGNAKPVHRNSWMKGEVEPR